MNVSHFFDRVLYRRLVSAFCEIHIISSIVVVFDWLLNYFIRYPKMDLVFILIGYVLILCKDFLFKGVKDFFGLKIYHKIHKKISIRHSLVRNISFVIWPIELILILFLKRRIGDFISGTIVVSTK